MNQSDSVRRSSPQGNKIVNVSDDPSNDTVIKTYLRKPLTFKMCRYRLMRALGREIPVEYRTPAERRHFERYCLSLWHERGFSVPELRPLPDHVKTKLPSIGMTAVPGERLDHFLNNPEHPSEEKLATIAEIYQEMCRRHCIAIFEQNHRLIHYDANLRNLIVAKDKVVHIDFEMGHLKEDIDRSAAREVKKFTLLTLNLIDSKLANQVLEILLARYTIRHIVLKLIDEELQRSFLSIHIKRDLKRKQQSPGLITNLDIAFRLERMIGLDTSSKIANSNEKELVKAIETSWDGKFYQSLDDSNPRGRDMNHRYEVMKIPDRFDNCSVLDIGCNIGRICVDAKKRGAVRAIGIDHRNDVVDAMNRHFSQNRIDVSLYTFDINDGVDALKTLIGPDPFEYVFVLSIWSHVDQQNLWDIINAYSCDVCYFEDNAPSRVRSLEKLQRTLEKNLNFSKIEFMGFATDRGVRAVFRLEK